MKTDNELIAMFDGYKECKTHPDYEICYTHFEDKHPLYHACAVPVHELKYDTSWDWLMPVVEKIGNLYHQAFPTNEVFIQKILAHEDPIEKEYIDVISTSICTPISEVYDEVVKFIKWYNQQPKQ